MYAEVKYGKMREHKVSWKVLKIFIQEGSNDDLRLTLSFSMARSNMFFCDFVWVKFMDFVEDFGARTS